ncbi:MAG: hypothetical protein E6Q67_03005 [Roseateles sp.]|nr:MAG: hypothetical protein E6Q67_03005 [Roseateles sp.]
MPTAIEAALDDLIQAAKIEPICGEQQLAEKRRALLAAVQASVLPPKVTVALRAAEASLTEMVRDGRAWDCDRRALTAVRDCLAI